jgi:diaminopimelate decarboxylase
VSSRPTVHTDANTEELIGARQVPVVFARNGNARLVVRRDTWDDLLVRDVD